MSQLGVRSDSWLTEEFDLDAYFDRLELDRHMPPTLETMQALHEAHVEHLPWSNLDVFLGTQPGVDPVVTQEQVLTYNRGGTCAEHTQLYAAALEDLGFANITRYLGRVVRAGGRTHMTVSAEVDGTRYLGDVGYGFGIRRPLEMVDGATQEVAGRGFHLRQGSAGGVTTWAIERDNGTAEHIVDEMPVRPIDIRQVQIVVNTDPEATSFIKLLIVARWRDGVHTNIFGHHATVRAPGKPTERIELTSREVLDAARDLGIVLVGDEPRRLLQRLEQTYQYEPDDPTV